MKIVKAITNNKIWGYGLDSEGGYYQPHLYIDAKPESLEVKLYSIVDNVEKIFFWHKLDISTLKGLNGFVDQTVWALIDNIDVIEIDGVPTVSNILPNHLVDFFSKTLPSKTLVNGNNTGYNKVPYVIYVDDSTGDFSDFVLVLKVAELDEFIFEGPSAQSITSEVVPSATSLLPSIALSSTQTTVGPDSAISVTITTQPFVKEVYLDPICGILNKTRVKLVDGVGHFQILTTGLVSGELVRAKAGFKKFTGTTEFSITVS